MTSTNRTSSTIENPITDERSRLILDLQQAYVLQRRLQSDLDAVNAKIRALLDRAKITR